MENSIHGPVEKPPAFPPPANTVSHSSAYLAVYAHSHSACCCEYPSWPVRSREKKEKKENKKRSGSVTLGIDRRRRSRSVMGKCSKQPFPPPKRRREGGMENHKGGSRKSRHRLFFSPFSALIPTLFRACGQVMGTGDERCPETLLAGMDTAFAEFVILASAVLPQEEGPLQPPFFTPAHRSCSGGFFCWALSGGLRSPHSRLASASRSRMEGFFSGMVRRASPWAFSSSSPLRPLFSIPSIIP